MPSKQFPETYATVLRRDYPVETLIVMACADEPTFTPVSGDSLTVWKGWVA